jgi:RNA polymerase-binding transcription factor DksA
MADKKKPAKNADTAKPATKPAAKPASKAAVAKPAKAVESKAKPVAPAPKAATKSKKVVEAAVEEEVKTPVAKANGAVPVKVSGFALKQRQRLLDLRDELVDAMSGMTGEIRNAPEGSEASGSGMHQGDAGSDAYDRDFALSVLAKEQDALYEIEQALRRIDRGAYGICEMSGKTIPQARLEAIPFARLTVECQAQWEKEYGNRRFRPSNEVGFSGGHYQDDEDSETVSLDEDDD